MDKWRKALLFLLSCMMGWMIAAGSWGYTSFWAVMLIVAGLSVPWICGMLIWWGFFDKEEDELPWWAT